MADFGLSDRSYRELIDIFASIPNIEEARVYGSRARGDYRRSSDVDLTLLGSRLSTHDVGVLKDRLSRSAIPLFFDAHIYDQISNGAFKANVDRDARTIYKREIERLKIEN